ncbi:MAG: type II toxin-antitoxin system VapC family toxin [Acidimicrobiia bacterium]|nr:type II toxin-antitoxin system VapC family toxin [Acidimicrobiia bacterium]MYB72558.1 type II toxin-antitoxin system VapC family toxin [Acidimicrobiia bacterium]MYH98027.1 type II toxin-antitoxin system VapC family toxin [Acidimicrobiia bacterium]
MSVLLDAGAFIAIESGYQPINRWLNGTRQSGIPLKTHGGVIAQVWRGGTRGQTRLARALRMVETVPLDEELGRQAGLLLARSDLSDAIDAALVAMADHGDEIITSDPDDLFRLVAASQRRINITPL